MWNEERLDAMLSEPSAALIGEMGAIQGDIMILGAGGKVGPSLSLMAKRAVEAAGGTNRVIAVSRFSDPIVVSVLKEHGVEMIGADLSDPAQVAALPKVPNVIYMAGRKFGTSGAACQTWAMNVSVPTLVAHHFQAARYVVFST
ncbi:MAG TPA: epimerase, partial [Clostridia bacterium]|nr:epimerase [Clostridia bacterium]